MTRGAGGDDATGPGKGDNEDGKRQRAAGKSLRSGQRRPPAKSSTARKAPAKRAARRPRKSA